MRNSRIKKAAFLTSFLGLMSLLVFTFLPSPRQDKSINFIPISGENKSKTPDDLPIHLIRKHLLTLSYPKWAWIGDPQFVILTIQPEESSPSGEADSSSKYSTSMEARMDLNSMEIYPGKVVFQALQSDKPAQFLWKVTAEKESLSSGKLWLSIIIHHSEEGNEWTIPIFAIPIEVEIRNWLGWPLSIIRGLIMTGLAFLIILWIIYSTPALKK